MRSLRYDTIIPALDKIFPDFANDYNLGNLTEGIPGVHLGFFISYAREHWNDPNLQALLADFASILSQSNEEATKVTFQDFALDFQLHFREHKINIESFLNQLLPEAKASFQSALNFWLTANKINKPEGS